MTLEELNAAVLAPHLHSKFRIEIAGRDPLDVTLCEVKEGQQTERQEQFWLVFCGPADYMLPQGIYHVEHAVLGGIDLFLVPIGRFGEGQGYQAVFNRLRPAAGSAK